MIDFELPEEFKESREKAAEFAEEVILPRAEKIDRDGTGVMKVWEEMGKEPYRYPGMHIPEKYGGKPRSLLESIVINEELTAVGKSPVCIALIELAGLGTLAILENASEELKNKYLPPVAKGKKLGCYALTEPGTGSDAAGLTCRAEKDGDEYVINGRKRYTSFAHESSHIILFAVTDLDKGSREISAFIVPTDNPGVEIIEKIETMGLRGHQDEELKFENCRIPEENRIGEEGKGLRYALGTLDVTRTTITAGYLGLARACLNEAIDYAKDRETFGKKLYKRQSISFPLSEISARIDAIRLLNYKAAWLHDKGEKHTIETAKAKTLASNVMLDAAEKAIETHGGFGCTKRRVVERLYRDARIWSFAQGTEQVMKFIISRDLFGKYSM